jgi:hypothetical protein
MKGPQARQGEKKAERERQRLCEWVYMTTRAAAEWAGIKWEFGACGWKK